MKMILGRGKTGKSTYIYDDIGKEIEKRSKDNLILIVPDLMTYQSEYDIISRLDTEGIMNVQVHSFKNLENKILEEVGRGNLEDINNLGRIMLLRQIFQENMEELEIFKNASNKEGFLKEFALLLKELKENQIDLDTLNKAMSSTDNSFLKLKLQDIALIYDKYSEKTQDVFFDEEDKLEYIISKVMDSIYIKESRIWIDGFESFNYQRIKLIEELEKHSKSLTISLNIDSSYLEDIESFDDWEAFKIIYDTYKSLEEIGGDIDIIPLDKSYISSDAIRNLEEKMFLLDFDGCNKEDDSIKIYSSMNQYTEVEASAQRIIKLVRDHNYRWKDIKIAIGNIDDYLINIVKVFQKFEIPYFLDIKRDIMKNPVTKYLLSILDMFIWNFRYEDVFEYLKTGFTSLSIDEINELENFSLKYGIEGSKWFKTMGIESDLIIDIKEKFTMEIDEKKSIFKDLKTIGEITQFLFGFLKLHRVNELIQMKIDRFEEDDKYEESSEYSQTWNNIMEVFEQILFLGEDKIMTPLEYRKVLETGFREIQISIIPPTIDKVEIGNIDRISVSKPKVLFILGTNEGKLDMYNERGLLLDEDRDILLNQNMKLLNSSNHLYFKGKHMLYKLFSGPEEKLYISYALGTIEGKTLEPSLYIDTIKRIFPWIKTQTEIFTEDEFEYISNHKATFDVLVENIRKFIDGSEIDDVWKEVYRWYKINDLPRYELLRKSLNYFDESVNVSSNLIEDIFKENNYTTVSKLENYAACEFKYFVENILKPRERPTEKVELYDLGNINHDVLEDFIDKIAKIAKIDDIHSLTEEDIYNLMEDSINKVLEDISKKFTALDANNRNKYLKNKLERVLKRTGYTLVKQLKSSEFRPRFTELQIGIVDKDSDKVQNGEYLDPIEIKNENYSLKLRGKIDRVDIFGDDEIYLSVIDYKSSGRDMDFTDIYEGIGIQLLVYLKALVENGEKLLGKKPKIGGVFYYHVNDPIITKDTSDIEGEIFKSLKLKGLALKDRDVILKMDKDIDASSDIIPVGFKKDGDFYANSKVITDVEFEKLLSFVGEKIDELTSGIFKGEFNINPYRKKDRTTVCTYCDYMSICQFDKSLGYDYRQIKNINKEGFFAEISEKEVKQIGMD